MERKKITILIVVICIIGVAAVLFFAFSNRTMPNSVVTESDSTQDVEGQPNTTPLISYANALAKYADRRIQLDANCQAHPNGVTYKDNTGIMIDNRSSKTRTIKVGTTFTIKPYGFKIVVLPDIYLKSKTLLVDCDKFQNVATIVVQE